MKDNLFGKSADSQKFYSLVAVGFLKFADFPNKMELSKI